MLVTWLDLAFVALGLAAVGYALWRRPHAREVAPSPPVTSGELLLTVLAAVPAAVGPNVLVVALTPGMPAMPVLTRVALLPSIGLLALVWLAARAAGYGRLANRIETGVWVGFVATAALDALRLGSFSLGLLPGNMPRMFGVLIFDRMAMGPTLLSDFVGGLYHYWISACFGLAYTLFVGRTRWWGGLIWGLIIEVGMMTTPPMVIAMDTGFFGLKLGKGILNGVFLGSLFPHISYGIVLGLLLERYVAHRGTLLAMLRAAWKRPTTTIAPGRGYAAR